MSNEFGQLLDDFGIPPPDDGLEDGQPPMPVDVATLAAFHERELDRAEQEEITFLIANYRDWYDADVKLLISEAEGRCEHGMEGKPEETEGDRE